MHGCAMTLSEMLNIGLMQGFAGLSLFAVLLLMGLGLAIIFGQMGVINMAHGEFMTIGAYTIFLGSTLAEKFAPGLMQLLLSDRDRAWPSCFAFALGWLVEWALIRHLYKRPLDTLLATWGVSLAMQQIFRTFIGAEGSQPDAARLADGLLGAAPRAGHPDQRHVRAGADRARHRRGAAGAGHEPLGPARARHRAATARWPTPSASTPGRPTA